MRGIPRLQRLCVRGRIGWSVGQPTTRDDGVLNAAATGRTQPVHACEHRVSDLLKGAHLLMPYLSVTANVLSWIIAGLVAIAVIAVYARRRYVKSKRASFAARISEAKVGTPAKPLPYQDAVRRANGGALRLLGGLLIGIPFVLVAAFLFVSGLAVADRTLMLALVALTAVTAVLLGVFLAIREGILSTIRHTGRK